MVRRWQLLWRSVDLRGRSPQKRKTQALVLQGRSRSECRKGYPHHPSEGALLYTRNGHISVQIMFPKSESALSNEYVQGE